MSIKTIQRIAFVKLSPQGKSYAMRCDREDLVAGHEVEVLMYAGTDRAYYDDGVITSISHKKWECSCHVLNDINEVTYSFDSGELTRKVDLFNNIKPLTGSWHNHKSAYIDSLPESVKSDMRDIYEAIAPEYGEDAYIGDGIWIRADGSMDDRGR